MSETIWKFPVEEKNTFSLTMPMGAKILCVQVQHGAPQIWAVVTESGNMETRTFRLAGTGHEIPAGCHISGHFNCMTASLWVICSKCPTDSLTPLSD